MKKVLLCCLLCSLGSASAGLGGKITFDDLYGLPTAEDPRISPDGARIAFVLNRPDPGDGTVSSHIWIMNADGSHQRQLTRGSSGDSRPRWSPDGTRLAFTASRDGSTQVWLLPLAGGEAVKATNRFLGARSMEWSPDGSALYFISSRFAECTDDACNEKTAESKESSEIKAMLFTSLMVRHYNTWEDGRVDQLFRAAPCDADARNVLPSNVDVPSALLSGARGFDISPDGSQVCLVMSIDEEPAVWVNNDLYLISQPDGAPRRITTSKGLDTTPRYSPDGKSIAYRSQARAGYESDQADLVLYSREDQKHDNLTIDFDRSIGEYVWAPEGDSIYFTAIDHGFSKVYEINVTTRKVNLLLQDAVYRDLRCSPDGRYLVVSRSRADQPYELFRYDLADARLTRLTHFTDPIVKRLSLSKAEPFWFEGARKDRVHGFLTRPPDFDPSKRYPLVLLIHGGPQWCWLGDFNYYGWNTQLLAAQGYVVAQIDPHGSIGYGLAFKEAVSGNWGKEDFNDLMKGMDYLLSHHGYVDPERTAALGRSYGGFMANWICGHTDRFRCLVSIDGTYEHISGYGATEELWFPEWEYRGTPWTHPKEYIRSSPATYAGNFKTPTLVIHGQHDYRVDLSQGLSFFTALQRQGVPSWLIYFPDEGHSVQKIPNLRYIYEKQFEWLASWLK